MLKPFAITLSLLLLFLVAACQAPAQQDDDYRGTSLGMAHSRIEHSVQPPANLQELVNRNHAVVVGTISVISEPVNELPYFTTEEDFANEPQEEWPYIEVVYYDLAIEEVLLDDGNIRDNARLRLMNSFWPATPQLGERYLFALGMNPDSKSYGISTSWNVLSMDDGIRNLDGTAAGYVGITDETTLLEGIRAAVPGHDYTPRNEWPDRVAVESGDAEGEPSAPGGPGDSESGSTGNTGEGDS